MLRYIDQFSMVDLTGISTDDSLVLNFGNEVELYLVTKAEFNSIHITRRLDEWQQFKVCTSAILPHLMT